MLAPETIDIINKLNKSNYEEIVSIIAKQGQDIIRPLIEYTISRKSSRTLTIMVIDKIGFPFNVDGVRFLISGMSNANSEGNELSMQVLSKMGVYIVPFISEGINYYKKNLDIYYDCIQSICYFLEITHREISRLLLPDLIDLIKLSDDRIYLFLLDVIKKIGSPDADIAIPIILAELNKNLIDEHVKLAAKCLEALDLNILRNILLGEKYSHVKRYQEIKDLLI